ncbi:hypothetical protein C922_03040 [Plasmodium inui San Antonio 1]|uniref:Uncharacterized protein n=1 Tax=Plasmodium inui San Antonio 1 TaxID=1237626 RepID=W7AM51_9APIC|nr:hypothetical protein C922_03040 [Plasmodium inui San Antonio 1]EUD66406.1 hypothetical protein C922_03040 [Plasmodium inui San Antonio 1]
MKTKKKGEDEVGRRLKVVVKNLLITANVYYENKGRKTWNDGRKEEERRKIWQLRPKEIDEEIRAIKGGARIKTKQKNTEPRGAKKGGTIEHKNNQKNPNYSEKYSSRAIKDIRNIQHYLIPNAANEGKAKLIWQKIQAAEVEGEELIVPKQEWEKMEVSRNTKHQNEG